MLGITTCHIIHAPTDRPEISYNVTLCATQDKAKDQLTGYVVETLESKQGDPSFRMIVYGRSTDAVDELASIIGCKPFHASRPKAEQAQTFKDWVEGKYRVVVATSLLGCGIDIEGVGSVVHYLTPWSVLDYAQESGRGGRGGRPSTSMIFASQDEREPEEESAYGKATMRRMVLERSQCRRTTLSAFLDKGQTTCATLPQAELCDVCREQAKAPHPGRLVRFSAPTIPKGDIPPLAKAPTIPPTSSSYELERSKFRELQR